MSDDQFTHKFIYEVNGFFIKGLAEFDTDDKPSFKITEWSMPMPLSTLKEFCNVMDTYHDIFDKNNKSLKVVQVKEIGV